MLLNYLKIALRNLTRRKLYSFINIFGLSVGLASALVIGSWVYQEWSYDRHFEDSDRIYRVGVNFYNIGDMAPGPELFAPVAQDFPEVEVAASLDRLPVLEVTVEDRKYEESTAFAADENFFELFSYPFKNGFPNEALDAPNEVVLTETLARTYFNKEEVLGESILIGEDQVPYTVVGVVEETPYKSHMPAKMWISLDRNLEGENWTSANYYNYVKLKKGFTRESLEKRLDQLIQGQIFPTLPTTHPYEEWINTASAYRFIPVSLTDIYLKTNMRFDMVAGGNVTNVYVFGAIALFILIIAAINFVNITTARSSHRAKEVGVRKSLGTGRKALVVQFLMESLVVSMISLVLALGLGELFLRMFEQLTGSNLLEQLFTGPTQIISIIIITVFIGLAAGLYPAFYLSSFNPASVLKGHRTGKQKSVFRNVLVITQFAIAISLLSSTGIVYRQLNFLQEKDLGLNTENVLVVKNAYELGDRRDAFRQQLSSLPGISTTSYNRRIPSGASVWVTTYKTREMENGQQFQVFFGDYQYLETLGFRLLDGRNFSREIAGDTAAVILNQAAVQELGLQDPVGSRLNEGADFTHSLEVIGVVSDFHFESLRNEAGPAAIMLSESGERLALKIHAREAGDLLPSVQQIWNSYDTGEAMNYYFLDQNYSRLLDKERVMGKAVVLFSLLAIIISCLGLFGLSAFICEQRTREIGIRKALGANTGSLVLLLNKNFTLPVLIGFSIAVPVSYLVMDSWLSNFAYKIGISYSVFFFAGITALLVAWITVSWQSFKTAKMNPVESLKNE